MTVIQVRLSSIHYRLIHFTVIKLQLDCLKNVIHLHKKDTKGEQGYSIYSSSVSVASALREWAAFDKHLNNWLTQSIPHLSSGAGRSHERAYPKHTGHTRWNQDSILGCHDNRSCMLDYILTSRWRPRRSVVNRFIIISADKSLHQQYSQEHLTLKANFSWPSNSPKSFRLKLPPYVSLWIPNPLSVCNGRWMYE